MKYNPLLEPYKALVPFLAELLGESCEILLHDISQPKHSVIAIANGFHTGRKVGLLRTLPSRSWRKRPM